jgi:hypothetical protein
MPWIIPGLSFTILLASLASASGSAAVEADQQHTTMTAPAGQMRLLSSRLTLHKPFKVTLYARGCGGHVELAVPPGMSLVAGEALIKPIPHPDQAGISQVTWYVIVTKIGTFPVKATASCGTTTSANFRAWVTIPFE